MKRLHALIGLVIAVVAGALLAAPAPAQHAKEPGHQWGYGPQDGPARWAELNPDFAPCKAGRRQSPIDIQETQKADLPAIAFDYKPSPLRIVDNGHTVMVTYAPGSSIRVGDRQFALQQFHFHRPSEERIHGKRYEMEVHLVHADSGGQLAVVALLLEKGKENAL